MLNFTSAQVADGLPFDVCIPLIRHAMERLSAIDPRPEIIRGVIPLGSGRMFGTMPGVIDEGRFFGAKLVGVFPDRRLPGRQRHHGVIVLFDGETGAPLCIADAEQVTTIRTAAASAVATEALARPDARTLSIFGCGHQAQSHLEALSSARAYDRVYVWGRDARRARAFALEQSARLAFPIEALESAEQAARGADVICTVTSADSPILFGDWVRPGAHINLVGSSIPGPVEVDTNLVAASRYFVDSRPSALAQAAEFLQAKAEGAIDDSHIRGEIGAVLSGSIPGRTRDDDVTVYKSLGHIVQDLASVRRLYEHAMLDEASPADRALVSALMG